MVELRKRKAVAEPVPAPGTKKNQTASKKATPKVEAADANGSAAAESKAASGDVGDVVTLEGFGGEIVTNDGDKTSLQSLVDASKSGVVLFTYPKASTPGCEYELILLSNRLAPRRAYLLQCRCLSFPLASSRTKSDSRDSWQRH